jgi:type IV pilus assembly protein PilW
MTIHGDRCYRHRERGFTLVEVMVAMTLGLIVLGVTITLFAGTSRGRADLERSNRLAENAQFALDMVGDELRHATFFADLSLAGSTWQVPDPCATAPDALGFSMAPFQVPVGVRGYGAGDPTPACIASRQPGTAMFTIRRLAIETTPAADATGAQFVQVSKCNLDTPRLWRYTSDRSEFTLRNIDCATIADVRRVVVRTYFVASCNECDRDRIPTLKRLDLEGNRLVETALVEGVENLQLEYGFDRDNDGNADVFLAGLSGVAGAPDNEWFNVVAVRVYVLGRSRDVEHGHVEADRVYDFGQAGTQAGTADAFKRTLLASLVRLPNVAGPREIP